MAGRLSLSRKEVPPSSVGASFRASTSGSFALFSLVGALYLIVALIVPGTFLIAKQASLLSSSPSYLSFTSAGSTEEDGGEDSWTGPQRLRGALLSKFRVGKASFVGSLLAAPLVLVATTPMLKPAERVQVVAEDTRPFKDGALPQELLGRGPPSSPS